MEQPVGQVTEGAGTHNLGHSLYRRNQSCQS